MIETRPTQALSSWIVVAMVAMIAIPGGIALHTVRAPVLQQITSPNPTPYGYTWSLLMFIIPIFVIAWWFLPNEDIRVPKRAFWWTIGVLVPFGFCLDFLFASRFFRFPNRQATIGVLAPAIGQSVPIEEYIFYLAGFVLILLLYVWLDEYWLAAYQVNGFPTRARQLDRLLQFHPWSVFVGLALICAAILYKKLRAASPHGFPLAISQSL